MQQLTTPSKQRTRTSREAAQEQEHQQREPPSNSSKVSLSPFVSTHRSLSPFCATRTAIMAAAMRTAKLVLLLVFLIQIVNMLAVSARPFKGEGWLGEGIEMVVDMLGDKKSTSNPPSHCCN
ncbi:hypothetical protein BAE44_0004231 [Dichanthelium oligosanthes]|uniref:Uncharacterized protein n=1 Tax=Dichanthelium oligosanthes TaxID=888268 RepID=A0A1E5WBH8_9POAL|nr:hypothetical protein BAE44_0004231 [Dichanthelium oligosanthes]